MCTLTKPTYIFLGSSVTCGADGRSMCEYLAHTTGANVIKLAVGGTTLSTSYDNSYVVRLLAALHIYTHCDHFICQLSTNDAGPNRHFNLGEISELELS